MRFMKYQVEFIQRRLVKVRVVFFLFSCPISRRVFMKLIRSPRGPAFIWFLRQKVTFKDWVWLCSGFQRKEKKCFHSVCRAGPCVWPRCDSDFFFLLLRVLAACVLHCDLLLWSKTHNPADRKGACQVWPWNESAASKGSHVCYVVMFGSIGSVMWRRDTLIRSSVTV